jgi:UDP-GlcNAc3NAcA epimerase
VHLVTIIGARPQFIKAAVVSRAVTHRNMTASDSIRESIIHTGQHYDSNMSDVFFDELDIPRPTHHLGIGGGSHGKNTGRMIEGIEAVLLAEKPDWVLVYGDTDSTLAGTLAAVKLHIPVAHVEAGLRSFNRRMPEEINRVLTDHAASLLFAPTDTAIRNLAKEGIDSSRIRQVGDVMYDAAVFYSARAKHSSKILETLGLSPKEFVLATIHRAENTDDRKRVQQILAGLATSRLPIVLPIHPRFRKQMASFEVTVPENVIVIDPVGYLDMVMLESAATVILTDSGGVQKEAYFHSVPCITMRDETEWVETVEAGWNRIVGADADRISQALLEAKPPAKGAEFLYGDGNAGGQIVRMLVEYAQTVLI